MNFQESIERLVKEGENCYAAKAVKGNKVCGLSEKLEEVPCRFLNREEIRRVTFYWMGRISSDWCNGELLRFPNINGKSSPNKIR